MKNKEIAHDMETDSISSVVITVSKGQDTCKDMSLSEVANP